MGKRAPLDRLDYSGSLDPVVDRLCAAYGIGQPANFSFIETGYEDCNVVIQTSRGKYVAKIFSKTRSQNDIARYATIMQNALAAGVHHPPLLETSRGGVVYTDHDAKALSLVLLQFVEGKTFLELGRVPDADERQMVIEQAVLVNSMKHHPPYIFDTWAIPNIVVTFEKVQTFLQPEDRVLVENVLSQYAEIPVHSLPHCFVHGDFTRANVLKGDDGKMYILDFSVANWYPRIQEIAVIAANLLYDTKQPSPLHERIELVIGPYNAFQPLTTEERQSLYPYALAGVAMELLGAHQEKYLNGNDSKETDFWLNLGRDGLREELARSRKE